MLSTFGVSTLIGDNDARYVALVATCDIVEYLTQDIRIENERAYFIRPEEEHDKHVTVNARTKQYLINSILITGVVDGMSNEEFVPLRETFEKLVSRVSFGLEKRLRLEGLWATHKIIINRDSEGAEEGDEDVTISFVHKNFA